MAKLLTLLRPVRLLLPALIPSWNFFDWIAPSPRIEYALSQDADEAKPEWQAFRPRPERLSITVTVSRLLFNARWNETLFLVSCAERLCEHPTEHSVDQIFRRLAADLTDSPPGTFLRFRLIFLYRADTAIEQDCRFVSEAVPLSQIIAS